MMNRKHAQTIPLREALEAFLNLPRFDRVKEAVRIDEAWRKIAGRTILKYTLRTEFENQILKVYVSSSVARNDLVMMQGDLQRKLNAQLKEDIVKEIQFF